MLISSNICGEIPYVVRNGRSGQSQHGVDIYGKPVHLKGRGSEIAGAQCKRVEALTEKDIKNEIEQATEFKPSLEEYLLLTTLKRDANLQRVRTDSRLEINRVEILFGKIYRVNFLAPMNFSRSIFRNGSKQRPLKTTCSKCLLGPPPKISITTIQLVSICIRMTLTFD